MAKDFLPDLLKMPDCNSLTDRGRCDCLSITECYGENCPFKKSIEELSESKERSYQRILSLDISKQIRIAKKYFDGNMPWQTVEK